MARAEGPAGLHLKVGFVLDAWVTDVVVRLSNCVEGTRLHLLRRAHVYLPNRSSVVRSGVRHPRYGESHAPQTPATVEAS